MGTRSQPGSQPGETRRQLRETKEQLREAKRQLKGAVWQAANLRKPGLFPRTVVDVGVNKGTPELYKAFPEAFQVLIEPLKENEPHLQRILQEYKGEYFLTAIGARDEVLTINVWPNRRLGRSSFYARTEYSETEPVEKRELPVTTLDSLLKKHEFEPPLGLKIDTEGFDYHVIEGARGFLRETQFVIAEVSVAKIYEDGYSFADFIALMDEQGFSLCDILSMGKEMSPSSELKFVDAMFRRANRSGADA